MVKTAFILLLPTLFLSACASGTFKARQEQREKIAASTGMFCEFISGDLFPDVDVELSVSMAKRCDVNRNFTITNYKNASDEIGVVYCCATKRSAAQNSQAPAPKKEDKSETLVTE